MEGTSVYTPNGRGVYLADVPRWERRVVGWLVRRVFRGALPGGPWPLPPELGGRFVRFRGNTGAHLSGLWFEAPDTARGTVVLVHPHRRYGQHWFVREGHVPWLLDQGFHVLTFDLAGYGGSTGGSTFYPEDVYAAVKTARLLHPTAPLHVLGVSLGAFAALNAAPYLDEVEGLVLESPYPTFNAWYGDGWLRRVMGLYDRVFPRTSRYIQGHQNAPRVKARRILVAAAGSDTVTPAPLSRAVADALPGERTTYLEVEDIDHLDLFASSEAYRRAILATLDGEAIEVDVEPPAAEAPMTAP